MHVVFIIISQKVLTHKGPSLHGVFPYPTRLIHEASAGAPRPGAVVASGRMETAHSLPRLEWSFPRQTVELAERYTAIRPEAGLGAMACGLQFSTSTYLSV